jgi:hypothetical protein
MIFADAIAMRTWNADHNGHAITVRKRGYSAELYIDGCLVDSQKGTVAGSLMSKLQSGESVNAVITAGFIRIHCSIYVDSVKVYSDR